MAYHKKIDDSEIIFLYRKLNSIKKVAKELNCSYTLVRYRLIKNEEPIIKEAWNKGIPSSEKVKNKISNSCKGRPAWNKGKKASEETKKRISESKKGCISPNKGKKFSVEIVNKISNSKHKNGKRYKNRSDTYWRNMARKKLLEKGFNIDFNNIVHHIDGDVTNNEMSNLKVLSRSEHTSLHHLQGDIHG